MHVAEAVNPRCHVAEPGGQDKRGASRGAGAARGEIVVAADAQDQLEILLPEPLVHAFQVVDAGTEHVEHVAALDQDVLAEAVELAMLSVGVADDREVHANAWTPRSGGSGRDTRDGTKHGAEVAGDDSGRRGDRDSSSGRGSSPP